LFEVFYLEGIESQRIVSGETLTSTLIFLRSRGPGYHWYHSLAGE
jgi:hypothetical protein